jgi:branched-chain amino acid transport system substrate-binding protein
VELICHDDAGDAARVVPLYRRLIDEDEVDLVIGGYGTNTNLAALPEISARRRFFVGLMALGANNEQKYENYFAMIPTGPDQNVALTESFFEIAAEQSPRPRTMGLLSADAVFARNPILGAHSNARNGGPPKSEHQTSPRGHGPAASPRYQKYRRGHQNHRS